MTREELAAKLNGRQYRSEITPDEEKAAKAAGLVVVFGASDDLVEFRGAINDEADRYDGGTVLLYEGTLYQGEECDCSHAQKAREEAKKHGREIEAVWCGKGRDGFDWSYDTDIPHSTFDIFQGDDPYCRGIVFELHASRGAVIPRDR